jgi:DNA-binding GntR family transcriptional regulator
VFLHQARQRRAIAFPIVAAQTVGLASVHVQFLHHPLRHLDLDLVKKSGRGGVERIVQVKDPSPNLCEMLCDHGRKLQKPRGRGNGRWGRLTTARGCLQLSSTGQGANLRASHNKRRARVQKDAYTLILEAIDAGVYKPGDRLVESELAERFGVSRTPVREALQRLETQAMLTRDGRSLMVASLDHNQLAELYAVRTELEGLAARLAARHATDEETRVLRGMVDDDKALLGKDPRLLSRANKRFHKQIHLASHNRFLIQQLDMVHRAMALMATTSFAAEGRDMAGLEEHDAIVRAIERRDGDAAYQALRTHISKAFETRLRVDAGELKTR